MYKIQIAVAAFVFFLSGYLCSQTNAGKSNWVLKKPFNPDVFVENKGQYNGFFPKNDKILYRSQLGNMEVYFTPGGIIYRSVTMIEKSSKEEEEGAENSSFFPPEEHVFSMKWVNSNPNTTIKAEGEQDDYYSFKSEGNNTIRTNAFKKIIYQNIYPGIDVEYSFPANGKGMKYQLMIHPGALVSQIKMKYEGLKELKINKDDEVTMSMTNPDQIDIIDKAPDTYYKGSKATILSSFEKQNDWVSFTIGVYDTSKEIIIDPWTIDPNFTKEDVAFDVAKDLAGNIYVYGGGGGGGSYWALKKFTSAGVPVWTYTTTFLSSSAWFGALAVDPAGNSYITEGCCAGTIEKINTNASVTWSVTNGVYEYWLLTFDCSFANLYLGCAYGAPTEWVGNLNVNTGAITNATVLPTGGSPNEPRAMAWAPNGNLYFLSCSASQVLAVTPAFASVFSIPSLYTFAYNGPKYANGGNTTSGQNGIAAGKNFFCTSDGKTLIKRNLITGALLGSVPIPGGGEESNSGVLIDNCGNVFFGSQSGVYEYDSLLNPVSNIATPGAVYCLYPGGNGQVLACGLSFVASLSFPSDTNYSISKSITQANCSQCSGNASVTLFLCGSKDTSDVSYLWSNGQTTSAISGLCSGKYTVTISAECSPDSYSDTIFIDSSGGLNATIASVNPTCAAKGQATVTINGGVPPYSYKWNNGNTASQVTGLTAGNYFCVVADNSGCPDTLKVTLVNQGAPVITATPANDSVCSGTAVKLTASGGTSYTWAPNSGLSCFNCPNPVATPLSGITYTVTGDSNGCTATAAVTIFVYPLSNVTVSPSYTTVCKGQWDTLTATGALDYTWTPATDLSCTNCAVTVCTPTGNDTYTIRGTDANGCSSTASATVNLALPAAFTLTPSQSICEGSTFALSVNGPGGDYLWQPGNVTGQSVTVSPIATTVYTVTLQGACGNRTDTVTIFVAPLPNTGFSADLTSGCSPLCINFRDLSSGSITAWSWQFGNGDTSDRENPLYCYSSPGTYSLKLTTTTNAGCSSTLDIPGMITVYSHPVSNFTVKPQPATIVNPIMQFTDASTDVYGIIYWQWLFGDHGDSVASTLENPTHTYNDTGTYCATLITTNLYGCTDSITHCLVIGPGFTLYIPNAFTPGSPNGLNLTFAPKGAYITGFEMYIYDRWGMQLYHTTDINQGWNGEINNTGSICQEDTYVYIIKVTDASSVVHKYLGKVSLLK